VNGTSHFSISIPKQRLIQSLKDIETKLLIGLPISRLENTTWNAVSEQLLNAKAN